MPGQAAAVLGTLHQGEAKRCCSPVQTKVCVRQCVYQNRVSVFVCEFERHTPETDVTEAVAGPTQGPPCHPASFSVVSFAEEALDAV